MTVVEYDVEMVPDLWSVYFTSIRMVCSRDYSMEQIEAWAPESLSLNVFREKMDKINPFVAISGGKVVGYSDLQVDGLIDHFYVHGECQGQGVGAELMKAILSKGANYPRLYSHVSHTAKPFYLKHGFSMVKTRKEQVGSVCIENNLMVKEN